MIKERKYLCIDLKSFYASCECADRGCDPFKTNLVVADPERGKGTVCLAVTPAMKALGVDSRCRLFEIPDSIQYTVAAPRMRLYMQKSSEIVSIYLRYVSRDDLHVYSIDECFIDITDYLVLYKKTAREFANMLRNKVFEETKICATAGIGDNLFLAKVALDLIAKKSSDCIGILDKESFKEKIWYHRPITDIWNIGPGIAARLKHLGVYDLHGVTMLPDRALWNAFGVNARFIKDHANGEESCTLADIKAYKAKSTSLSSSQILFRDYNFDEAKTVLCEMTEQMVMELLKKRARAGNLGLYVGYSHTALALPDTKSIKLEIPTRSLSFFEKSFETMYETITDPTLPIRRLAIRVGDIISDECSQISVFDDEEAAQREENLLRAVVNIQKTYGKNSIVRCRDFDPCATLMARNAMVGGHRA